MFRRLLVLLCTVPLVLAVPERPNIVLIVADDMGYSDLGCYGGEIGTPHLDALADSGLRFTNYYVNNMCWPTRASLMTGLYPGSALSSGGASGGLHPDTTTLPQALRSAGYTTLMSGKWHLSDPKEPDGPHAPHHRGFDHFYGTIYGASDFFAPADLQLDGRSMVHEWRDNPGYYYTDALTDHAITFLRQADPGKPFFLFLSYTAAHWPLHARPDDIGPYEGRYKMGWDKLREERHARMKKLGVVNPAWKLSPRHPGVPDWSSAPHKEWQERRMEVYAAQVTCMDRNIGRVIRHLRNTGVLDNTLVLYQHDNGGCHVEYAPKRTGSWTRAVTTDGANTPVRPGNVPGLMPGPQSTFQSYGYGWANASNTPFRLFKQHDHEGGTRSPLIVSWPAAMETKRRGALAAPVCHAIDLMPTLLEAAGLLESLPPQQPAPFAGRSFLPAVRNGAALPPRPPLFWAHASGRAVRDGDWKLVSAGRKAPWELYNLAGDGTELHDLSASMPEKVAVLAKLHADWISRTSRPREASGRSSQNQPRK